MSTPRLTLYLSSRAEFRQVVQEQLKQRCLLVPTDEPLAWDTEVEIRLLVRGRALDLHGRVVNPDLQVGGQRILGVLVDLTRSEWAAIGFLERAFLSGDDEPSSDLEAPGAALRLRRRDQLTGSSAAVSEVEDPATVPVPAAAIRERSAAATHTAHAARPGTAVPAAATAGTDTDASTDKAPAEGGGDLDTTLDGPPYQGFGPDIDDDALDSTEVAPTEFDERPETSRRRVPANAADDDLRLGDPGGVTFDQSTLEAARQDAVRRTIETVKPLANPRLASSSEAVAYRADQPEKARRADELATSAATALADGDLQQARVMARLAVVYNPHEPEFRALSELVENRIVQIDDGAAS